jgi:hypothetical protein
MRSDAWASSFEKLHSISEIMVTPLITPLTAKPWSHLLSQSMSQQL